MKRKFALRGRVEFLFLAFKFCAFRQKFLLRNIYYQDLIPDFDFLVEIPRIIEQFGKSQWEELEKVNFAPFGLMIGSTVDELFNVLGRPIFMDSSTYRKQKCFELQYRTKVGKLKCKLSFLVSNFRIQLILLQIVDGSESTQIQNPVELLLGHKLKPNQTVNNFFQVGPNFLRVEHNSFRSQFLISNDKLKSIKRFEKQINSSRPISLPCERIHWYRKTFGTLDDAEI